MAEQLCLRWRERRSQWAPYRAVMNPARHAVVPIEHRDAQAFIVRHHYSASVPPIRRSYGLMRRGRDGVYRLSGAIAITVPMQGAALPRWCGVSPAAGAELGRLVLLDEVEFNAESWFVARALRQLREDAPQLRALVSYSDPVPRRGADGNLILPGHVGTVYQALNARCAGRSSARTLWLDRDGQVVSERSLSKLRNGERGAGYAYRRLRAAGAPSLRPGEAGDAYVRRALAEGPFRRVRHPGNHVYLFAVGDRRHRRRVMEGFAPPAPYPEAVDQAA